MQTSASPSLEHHETSREHAPKVSVIIPLYYAEDYIDSLLNQLRTQPLEDIEVICVVDGSPDGTLDVVKRHAAEDQRVQWLYQENAGAGVARNAGIELASGDYLSFVDADDLYEEKFLSIMHEAATEYDADLVVCQVKRLDCSTGQELADVGFRADCLPPNEAVSPSDVDNIFSSMSNGPSNKLYRRSLVEREHLRFSGTFVANDVTFVFTAIASSSRIVAIPDSLIHVRRHVNPHSISSNRALHSEDAFVALREIRDWLVTHGLWERHRPHYTSFWAGALHYNASYDRNERFIKDAARILATEEPWCTMSDRELRQAARLEMGLINVKRLVASHRSDPQGRATELQYLENEAKAISEIINLLNAEYGKSLPTHPSLLGGIVSHMRKSGVRNNARKFFTRMLAW